MTGLPTRATSLLTPTVSALALALLMPGCLFTNPATPQGTSQDMGSVGEDMSAPSDMTSAPGDMVTPPPTDMATTPDIDPPSPDMPPLQEDMGEPIDMAPCACPMMDNICPQVCDCTTEEDARRLCVDPGQHCDVILTETCFKKRDVIRCQDAPCMDPSGCSTSAVVCVDSFLTDNMASATSGQVIATSGDWLAVSDPFDKIVRLYERGDNNTWVVRQAFNKPGTADLFGVSLAMSGNILAVGAPVGTDRLQSESVFIYEFDGAMWKPGMTIISPDDASPVPTGFGSQVALDGDLLAVSQVRHPTEKIVRLYERRAMVGWREIESYRNAPNPTGGSTQHSFGRALALDNNLGVLAIGDPVNATAALCARTSNEGTQSGWEIVQTFTAESVYKNSMPALESPERSEFGASVAIGEGGNGGLITIAVGAPNATLRAIDKTGYVVFHDFTISDGDYKGMASWEPLIDSPGGRFGAKLVATGSGVLVTAPDYLHANGATGTIFEFAEGASGVPQITLLEAGGGAFADIAIAVNEERGELAIGLPNHKPGAGTFSVIPLPSSLAPQGGDL